jgi:phasin family protein
MTNTAADFNAFVEQSRKYAEPAIRLQAVSAKAVERVARFGYDVVGDYLNFGLAALQATTEAKDLPGLIKAHTELAQSQFEKQTQRSQDLMKIAAEAQSDMTHWFDTATVSKASKAAKAA